MISWLDITLNDVRHSFTRNRISNSAISSQQYPVLLDYSPLRRPTSASGGEAANMSVNLDNTNAGLTKFYNDLFGSAAEIKYINSAGDTVTLFSGKVNRIAGSKNLSIEIIGDGLTDPVPLRRVTELTSFASTDFIPYVFGEEVRYNPIRFSSDGREWLLGTYITRVRKVEVNGATVDSGSYELTNRQDNLGKPIATLLLASPAEDDQIAVTVDGDVDPLDSSLIENPAVITWFLQTKIGSSSLSRSSIDPLRIATNDLPLRGLINGSQSTQRSQIDEILSSAGCIWSAGAPGFGRIWPIDLPSDEFIAGTLTRKIDSDPDLEYLEPVNVVNVLYGYDWYEEDFTKALILESQESIRRYGRKIETLELKWVGSDRVAEKVARRYIAYHCRAKYEIKWRYNAKDALDRPPLLAWQINHANIPVTGLALSINSETDPGRLITTITAECATGPNYNYDVIHRSQLLGKIVVQDKLLLGEDQFGIRLGETKDGEFVPLKGAKVTLGGIVSLTNSDGVAFFTGIPEGTYRLTIEAEGYPTQTNENYVVSYSKQVSS